MERRWRETDSDWIRDDLAKYQSNKACDVCNGHRLKPEALAVKLDGLHISQVAAFSVAHAAAWFSALNGTLRPKRSEEHTSELQSLMRISYAVFCLQKKL